MIPLEGDGGVEPQTTSRPPTHFSKVVLSRTSSSPKLYRRQVKKTVAIRQSLSWYRSYVYRRPCVDLLCKHSRVFALTSGLPYVKSWFHVGYLEDNPGVEEGRELESQGVTPVPFSKQTCILCILPSRILSPSRPQSIGVDSPATLSRDTGGSTGGRFTPIRKQKKLGLESSRTASVLCSGYRVRLIPFQRELLTKSVRVWLFRVTRDQSRGQDSNLKACRASRVTLKRVEKYARSVFALLKMGLPRPSPRVLVTCSRSSRYLCGPVG